MTTLKDIEDAILELASKFPDPVLEAVLVHKDDFEEVQQLYEEKGPNGVKVYKWDGNIKWFKLFGGTPEPGKPVPKYSFRIQKMAASILKRRKVDKSLV